MSEHDYWTGYDEGKNAAANGLGGSTNDGMGCGTGLVLFPLYLLGFLATGAGAVVAAFMMVQAQGRPLGGLLFMLLFNLAGAVLVQTAWQRYKRYRRIHHGSSLRSQREREAYEARSGKRVNP